MAETRAAALALVSNGHKMYEAVHALSITTDNGERDDEGLQGGGSESRGREVHRQKCVSI
jgi:hypothetical protein